MCARVAIARATHLQFIPINSVSFPVELDLAVILPPLPRQPCIHSVCASGPRTLVTARVEECLREGKCGSEPGESVLLRRNHCERGVRERPVHIAAWKIQVEDLDEVLGRGVQRSTSARNSGGEYRATDVDIEACDEGGFNVGRIIPGEWLKYTVRLSQSGAYTLEFRVASPGTGGTFHIEVNGVDRTVRSRRPLPGVGRTGRPSPSPV